MKKTLLITAIILFPIILVSAPDTSSNEFWLAMPGNYWPPSLTTEYLYIASETGASGTIYIPGIPFTRNFTVPAGSSIEVQLHNDTAVRNSDTLEYKGIHVTSDNDITVYGMNVSSVKTDGYLAIPEDALGTEYILISYPNSVIEQPDVATQFAVCGTKDGTSVTMVLSVDTGGYTAGTPYVFTLNEGQVYYLKNDGGTGMDFTGTYISANMPIAVFSSHSCANVPVDDFYCDYLVEQEPPITSWGKEFIIVPFATRTGGDRYRITSSENSAAVLLDGSPLVNLNAGETYEVIINGGGRITCNKRILVMQFAHSTTYDGITGDPAMMINIPVEQYVERSVFHVPDMGYTDYLNVVAADSDVGLVTIDGFAIPPAYYTAIGGGYSAARVPVSNGYHLIAGTQPLAAYVYGFSAQESYAYPAGISVIDFVSTKTVTPTLTETNTEQIHTLTVTPTITPSETITSTSTITPSPPGTLTLTETITPSSTATVTSTITETPVETETFTGTETPTETCTETNTLTYTDTQTPSETFTETYTQTVTLTYTQTFTNTATNTFTATFTGTQTPVPFTSTPTPTFTQTPGPLELVLKGFYPNPARHGRCNAVYELSIDADVEIKIFTVSGEVVVEKGGIKGKKGYNSWCWDGKNRAKKDSASGVYIFKIKAKKDNKSVSAGDKLIVIR